MVKSHSLFTTNVEYGPASIEEIRQFVDVYSQQIYETDFDGETDELTGAQLLNRLEGDGEFQYQIDETATGNHRFIAIRGYGGDDEYQRLKTIVHGSLEEAKNLLE